MQAIDNWLGNAPVRTALAWVAAWAVLSVFIPIDACYDVLHYHLQNGWSATEGRLETDIAPAGMHSYFNPLHNMAVHGLITSLPAAAVTILLAVIQALVLVPLYLLSRRVLVSVGYDSRLGALLASVAGFCSYSMLSMTASVRNDHWIAGAFIGALVILLPSDGGPVRWRRAALAAFLTGLAIGLKLTAVIYAAGLAAAILIAVPGVRGKLQAAAAAAIAGAAGILLTGGWWFHRLWETTGNPVFPMANGIFRSPLAPPENFRDARGLPENLLDVLLHPVNGPWRFNEYSKASLQDLPLGLLYIAIAILAVHIVRKRNEIAAQVRALPRPLVIVVAATVACLVPWFGMFAIGRYAIAIWMLSPLILAATALRVWPALRDLQRSHLWLAALAAICFLAGSTVGPRRIPVTEPLGPYIAVEAPPDIIFDRATVIFTGGFSSAFLAAHLPESATHAFALTQEWSRPVESGLSRLVRERIKNAGGPLIAVMADAPREGPESVTGLLARLASDYGVRGDASDCRPFRTSVDGPDVRWVACPLTRASANPES